MKRSQLSWWLLAACWAVCSVPDATDASTTEQGTNRQFNITQDVIQKKDSPPRRNCSQRGESNLQNFICQQYYPHYKHETKSTRWGWLDNLLPSWMTRHSVTERYRRIRRRNAKTAFQMAILSALAYWEFHHRPDKSMVHPRGFSVRGGSKRRGKLSNTAPFLSIHFFLREQAACSLVRVARSILLPLIPPYDRYHERHRLRCPRRPPHHPHDQLQLQYWLYNFFEPSPFGNFHDTDVLVATNSHRNEIVLAFAGTASPSDAVTNLQTFEKASHSGIFHGGRSQQQQQQQQNQQQHVQRGNHRNKTKSIEGSIHRGFLNAYSRVERGSVLRLGEPGNETEVENDDKLSKMLRALHEYYGHCYSPQTLQKNRNPVDRMQSLSPGRITRTKRNGGCLTQDVKLMEILQETVTTALQDGRTVHLAGHSLGGGVVTLLALDVIINFPHIPIRRLHVWTFGAPQVVDDTFVQSAMQAAPRLQQFLGDTGRFHRFVTLSDDCEVDFVATVTEWALPVHMPNLLGNAARKLGGVNGTIVHVTPPQFVLTPHQLLRGGESDGVVGVCCCGVAGSGGGGENSLNARPTTSTTEPSKLTEQRAISESTTRSRVAAHAMINYLQGINYLSSDYPLQTDLPPSVVRWIGI